jgi:hypothetical protein
MGRMGHMVNWFPRTKKTREGKWFRKEGVRTLECGMVGMMD